MRKDQAVVTIDDEPIVVDGSPRKEKLPLGEPCVVEASADIGDDGLVDVSQTFATPVKTSKKAVETFSTLKKMESSQPHAVAMEVDNETGVSAGCFHSLCQSRSQSLFRISISHYPHVALFETPDCCMCTKQFVYRSIPIMGPLLDEDIDEEQNQAVTVEVRRIACFVCAL